jgi:methionine sulfoxide reductase heme-binding subunit
MRIPEKIKQPMRWLMHFGCLLPLILLVVDFFTGNLTVNPIQAATQRTGLTALVILTIMLSFTPLAGLTHEPYWRSFRKPVGLYAFLYASLHLILFAGIDFGLNLRLLAEQITQKPFVILGMASFILLAALAVTSFKALKKRMGRNWKRLHQTVYLIAPLVVVHFALAQKANPLTVRGNILLPLLLAGVILILLALRLPPIKRLLHM